LPTLTTITTENIPIQDIAATDVQLNADAKTVALSPESSSKLL
jgi:hypothetical protein